VKLDSYDPSNYNLDGGLRRRLADLPAGVRWGTLAVTLSVVVFIVWLGFQGKVAKSNLEQAKTAAQQAKNALLNSEPEAATRSAERARFHAQRARSATHSIPWAALAAVPLLGSPLKTTQQISDITVDLVDEVLIPGAEMGVSISPEKLIEGDKINLQLLADEEPSIKKLAAAASELDADARAMSNPRFLSAVRNARDDLQKQISRLAQLLTNTAIAADLAPPMMGADGPRSYLMVFQTPAEARGTGGLLGGVGILRFDNGIPSVEGLGTNVTLKEANAGIDLGPEFDKVYGWTNPYDDFRNSNMSPHFPFAARIWQSMWEEASGVKVDGVIALDPVVLSYLLGAIGPVQLTDGEVISQENVVELTTSTAYQRFASDQWARKLYLLSISKAVVKKMTGTLPSERKLLDAIGRAISEGRVSIWSDLPNEQALLQKTPLAHAVPDDAAPYAQVVVNNLAGNKMDYYLKREIEYVADACNGEMRNSTVTVKLTNTAPPGTALPENVASTTGLAPELSLKVPDGTMVTSVRLLATKGSKLMSVTSNGERTPAITQVENGRPSFEIQVAIPPGQSGELAFRLREPSSPGEPKVPVQPLLDNVSPRVSVPACP